MMWVRQLLRWVLTAFPRRNKNIAAAIRRRFADFDGLDLELPKREEIRYKPDLAQ
jgi:hypothetical protein